MIESAKRQHVLVVDDDQFMLETIKQTLHHIGCENVQTCEKAEHALDLVNGDPGRFNLVFCDLHMPSMNGIEFLSTLGNHGYKGNVAIISSADQKLVNSAEKLAEIMGVTVLGSLEKPVSIDSMSEMVIRSDQRRTALEKGSLS